MRNRYYVNHNPAYRAYWLRRILLIDNRMPPPEFRRSPTWCDHARFDDAAIRAGSAR